MFIAKPIEYVLPLPTLHRKVRRPVKTNIIGERLGAPKILTLPSRIEKIDIERQERQKRHDKILQRKQQRLVAKTEREKVKSEKAEKKKAEEIRLASVTRVVLSAGYCVRTPPSIKQIKSYLKGEKGYTVTFMNYFFHRMMYVIENKELNHITSVLRNSQKLENLGTRM